MNTNSKRADWEAHVNEWSKSSLTQKAFCQQKGLSLASFGYWRKKLASKKRSSNLIPVTVSAPTTIRVRLHWGADIDVPVSALETVLPILARSVRGLE